MVASTHAQNSATTTNAVREGDDINWARHVVQAYQDYQRQQKETAEVLSQTRQDAALAAQAANRNTAEIENRLHRIEQSLSLQRQREIENMQAAQRSTLVIVGYVAAVGLVCMLILALLLLRTMNKRMETLLAPLTGATVQVGQAFAGQLGTGDTQLIGQNPAEQSNARFLAAIERLEKRVAEMEVEAAEPVSSAIADPVVAVESPATDPQAMQIRALLGKGQTFLNLDQFDDAIACFDEVLALAPQSAEALVKKGTALEKTGKLDEAVQHYDRAIAADEHMALAYLCKGGVYNRLERYSEALECYEKALHAKEQAHVA